MKKLILSETRCDFDYNGDCNYILMLLDESGARDLLALVDRITELQVTAGSQFIVRELTVSNFIPVKVASSLEKLRELPDAEIDVVEGGGDEIAVCDAPNVQEMFDACPRNLYLFNTAIDLIIRNDTVTIEARPKHLDASVYSHSIPLQVLQDIAGMPVSA